MAQLTLTLSYEKDTGIALSATDIINLYFFGTPPRDLNGNTLPSETIDFYIKTAQKEIEHFLNVKLNKTYIKEDRSFFYDDWIQWGYMPTSYPVISPKALRGFYNTSLQIEYPNYMLKAKTQSPDKDLFHRNIHLIPSGQLGGATTSPTYFAIGPYLGFFGGKRVPYYWRQEYTTGYDLIPIEIIQAIGLMAAINIFIILQDSILGGIGVVSKSIGIDGLSQSVSLNSKGIYANRIELYSKMLDDGKGNGLLMRLKGRHTGILFTVC